MKFTETPLSGAFVVEMEPHRDERGFFARHWCQREFEARGLASRICQINFSSSHKRGTLRGLHYQSTPFAETKLVRCVKGAIFDVIIDLRIESATYGEWFGVELSAENYKMVYVPEQFGHGYLSLWDDTEAMYQTSEFYRADAEMGIRYDDKRFNIKWPLKPSCVSAKDLSWPDYCDS